MITEPSDWIMIIGNFGFPIAITVYLFIRFEKKIENLELSINKLSDLIKNVRKD
ncbi:YvrJ family protein [Lysinibacillus sp. NPDC097279]|uniref:YvrJ family protein n=1 Tax=unclassified Lysinibacillus TaxID=2636778 RepID=UPI001173445B|nr:YvrJ family protein [Lysinibacillus sp. CD3-6]QPQ37315.1 YvrJ family protein [Lysinibacillus sp. JNUCC-52]UED80888.1 YvrJ family protein [Lysinibacillus sp. CD3-6]